MFVAVHHALTGLHLALVFAPNHKGMPIFEKEEELDWFTRQVVTARNIYANPITTVVKNDKYAILNSMNEERFSRKDVIP